jgi:hypothetical protein
VTHLDNAKRYLAIAGSVDADPKIARREAYKAAADEIAAYKTESGDTNKNIAIFLGCSPDTVAKLLAWRRAGHEADTPFLMDAQATTRARASHARTVLREPAERQKVIESLTQDEVADLVETVARSQPKAIEQAVVTKPKSAAATVIRTAAETDRDRRDREVRDRIKQAQDRANQARPKSTPSQYFFRMIGKFREWVQGLQWLESEAGTLKPDERPEIAERLIALRDAVESCLAAVQQDADGVIDSTASNVPQRALDRAS